MHLCDRDPVRKMPTMKMQHAIHASNAVLIGWLLGVPLAQAAGHGNHSATRSEAVAASDKAPVPKLTLLAPDPEILKGGYVYLPFHVEHMTLLPMYTEVNGDELLRIKPKVGHLHVGVDDTPWVWIHALSNPIYFGPLPPGAHKVRVEIVDSAHQVIDIQTIHFVIPKS